MTYDSTKFTREAKAFSATNGATAHKLADNWYIVTRGDLGDFAYKFRGASSADEPTTTIRVAVRYYMSTGRLLLKTPGEPVLTSEQIDLLSMAREPWADE